MADMTGFEKFASDRVMSGMERSFARDAWKHATKNERERCAKILDAWAKAYAEEAGEAEGKDQLDLQEMAWSFNVIEQEIIDGEACAP